MSAYQDTAPCTTPEEQPPIPPSPAELDERQRHAAEIERQQLFDLADGATLNDALEAAIQEAHQRAAGGCQGGYGVMIHPPGKGALPPPLRLIASHAARSGIGGYAWRRARGLLTISDHVRLYRAIRTPRGAYRCPLPEDLILCGRGRT